MGVPKKHKTRSGRDQRRSHHALKVKPLAISPDTGEAHIPGYPTPAGWFKGRKVTK
jgi:large subunit ribosomal protein L32